MATFSWCVSSHPFPFPRFFSRFLSLLSSSDAWLASLPRETNLRAADHGWARVSRHSLHLPQVASVARPLKMMTSSIASRHSDICMIETRMKSYRERTPDCVDDLCVRCCFPKGPLSSAQRTQCRAGSFKPRDFFVLRRCGICRSLLRKAAFLPPVHDFIACVA